MELDYRGHMPRGILVITGTKIEVPCVFKSEISEEQIKSLLKQRIWAFGDAIYDGEGQLPVRVEVASMKSINQTGTPSKWEGAMMPFEPSDWGAENGTIPKQ
ncbi:hypothetical protein CH339_19765 [Rhodobium orientis]|uniref:Uncharacterized protein n=2 Tax=Rhodobium orientis TaxID=34017 RepID=A0A327JJY0_9HYPH|nr:hypothetical protein [Rhodobium orientis]RAI25112.1 hypothetical protein CH339_19765 [Rhodobium orientis]